MIEPGTGIAGCTFADPNTRGFAFDLNGSGKRDHLVFYYPTQNSIYIIQQQPGDTFTTVYSSAVNPPNTALPGSTYLIQHQRQTFTAIYPNAANPAGKGLAGFNFKSPSTQCFAYDCEGSGKQDYLFFYVPGGYGGSTVAIIKINQGSDGSITYSQVFSSTQGLGGYDLANPADLGFAFDYNGTGGLNNITLYRPADGTFAKVYSQINSTPGFGAGNVDLTNPADRVIAFDFLSNGKLDHLLCYRPNTGDVNPGLVSILQNNSDGTFQAVFTSNQGIGRYNLDNPIDKIVAFDYLSSGKLDHLVCYRSHEGI